LKEFWNSKFPECWKDFSKETALYTYLFSTYEKAFEFYKEQEQIKDRRYVSIEEYDITEHTLDSGISGRSDMSDYESDYESEDESDDDDE